MRNKMKQAAEAALLPGEKYMRSTENKNEKLRRNILLAAAALLLSVGFLLVCSQSSPLYPMNNWVDVNCFFTMGRGILGGKVPYRDLYEQKGPVLYFFYALAALVSETSYIGVFILEVISFALFLFFAGKLAELYFKKPYVPLAVMLGAAYIVPVSSAFSHGSSVEEMNLCFLTFTLWQIFAACREKRPVSGWGAFGIGLGTAVGFWSKYTFCGFYAGAVLAIPVLYASMKLPFRKFLRSVGLFLAGFAVPTAAVAVYFGLHGALSDLIQVYFINNITLYPTESTDRLQGIFTCLKSMVYWNRKTFSHWILAGGCWLLISAWKRWRELLTGVLAFAGLTATTYYGLRAYDYYGLIFAAFAVLGLIAVPELLLTIGKALGRGLKHAAGRDREMTWTERRLREKKAADPAQKERGAFWRSPEMRLVLTALFSAAMVFAGTFLWWNAAENTPNLYLRDLRETDSPQYRFAEIIRKEEDPKILNFGFLDGGFYLYTGTLPECRYFCNFNIEGTDMWDVQREYIRTEKPDFIVTRTYRLTQYSVEHKLYREVAEGTYPYDGRDYAYYLYQRIQ